MNSIIVELSTRVEDYNYLNKMCNNLYTYEDELVSLYKEIGRIKDEILKIMNKFHLSTYSINKSIITISNNRVIIKNI